MTTKSKGVHARIVEAIGQVKAMGKDHTNTHFKYRFRSIDDLYGVVNPVFAKVGLFVVPTTEEMISNNGLVRAKIRWTFYGADGDSLDAVVWGESFGKDDKNLNKCIVASFKMCLFTVLSIPVEGTDDADAHAGTFSTTAAMPSKPAQKAPQSNGDFGNPISPAQGKRLYAIYKSAGKTDEEVQKYIFLNYGWKNSKDIGWKAYEEICKWAGDTGTNAEQDIPIDNDEVPNGEAEEVLDEVPF